MKIEFFLFKLFLVRFSLFVVKSIVMDNKWFREGGVVIGYLVS